MNIGAWIWIGLFVIGAVLFLAYSRTEQFLRCVFFTAGSGLCALGLVWLAGRLIGLPLEVTPLTVGVSAVLGVPGVVGMLLLCLI